MSDLKEIRVAKTPVTELANFNFSQGYSEINRVDQNRSITVTAEVEAGTRASEIVSDLKKIGNVDDIENVPTGVWNPKEKGFLIHRLI